jgi:cytochrome c-type biogenesis protein CcmH
MSLSRSRIILLRVLCVFLWFVLAHLSVLAQGTPSTKSDQEFSVALTQTPTPNQINAIAKELWCPLCNGVRLDNCELQACIQMREVIAQKLAAGESKEQIKVYFVQQYGDVVLGAPVAEGFNLLIWILPIMIGVVGLGWLVFFIRAGLRHQPAPAKASPAPAQPAAKVQADYLKRVDDELRREQ